MFYYRCAQKNSPLQAGFEVTKNESDLSDLLSWLSGLTRTVLCHSDTKSAVGFVPATLSISTTRSHPSHFLHGPRPKLRSEGPASRGSCGEEMDGSKRTAVSSNCKILVILDSGFWLMGLIWRLNSFGPPLNTGGREEGITDHSEEGLRHGRWRPDVVEPVRKCNRL